MFLTNCWRTIVLFEVICWSGLKRFYGKHAIPGRRTSVLDNHCSKHFRTNRGIGIPPVKRWLNWLFVAATASCLVTGCSVLRPIESAPVEGGSSQAGKEFTGVYRDFDDILIPKILRVNRKMSSVFETATISAGVLSLGGPLKMDELIEYFMANMTKDNWAFVSMFKGPRSILQFEKGNRWCAITLMDRRYTYETQVEIWVTPKTDAASTGLLK
jgi:hypothetical protein